MLSGGNAQYFQGLDRPELEQRDELVYGKILYYFRWGYLRRVHVVVAGELSSAGRKLKHRET
jgi:hypothetical protein